MDNNTLLAASPAELITQQQKQLIMTERGGSVVTHETRILEVPGSNPGADQPDWGFEEFWEIIYLYSNC